MGFLQVYYTIMTSISSLNGLQNALLRLNDDLEIIIMDKKTYIGYRLSQHRAPNVLVGTRINGSVAFYIKLNIEAGNMVLC